MAKLLKVEEAALRPLLEREWESADEMMEALVEALDEARGGLIRHVVVMQFGDEDGKCWYYGIGPYPGRKSAMQAVRRFPGATMASKIATVAFMSPAALDQKLKKGA